MKIYELLSKIGFLKNYSLKFLFVAFLGIHVPLIGLIVWISFSDVSHVSPVQVLVITLVLTLVATIITLLILNNLLAPLLLSQKSLAQYIQNKVKPNLPTHFKDEAGLLMAEIQATIDTFDRILETKKDLVALLSHDIRTPISAIMMSVEMMKISNDEESKLSAIQQIKKSGQRLLDLIAVVHAYLRHDEAITSKPTYLEAVSLKGRVGLLLNEFNALLQDKGLNTIVNVDAALEVKADKTLLTQVLQNILSNAIKFSKPNGQISIAAARDNGVVTLRIKDDGIGFKPELNDKIFEKFTSESKQGTKGESSSGLGMYLSKKIIEKMGGRITAYSEGEGRGAEFIVQLPSA